MTDWTEWHREYADPASALSQRLDAVVSQIRQAVDLLPAGPIRVISACSGEARDLCQALGGQGRASDVAGRAVEADPRNEAVARVALTAAGLTHVQSVCADASVTDAYVGSAPADLVLLCGIFGNITDDDVRNTIEHTPMLCAPGATVIWTRHRQAPDLTPTIRAWFAECGFDEVAFESPGPEQWAVGVHRLVDDPVPFRTGVSLFTFVR